MRDPSGATLAEDPAHAPTSRASTRSLALVVLVDSVAVACEGCPCESTAGAVYLGATAFVHEAEDRLEDPQRELDPTKHKATVTITTASHPSLGGR